MEPAYTKLTRRDALGQLVARRRRAWGPRKDILNLWPPPVMALGLLGVDINDLGAPCYTEFRSVAGRVRVRVNLSEDVLVTGAPGR